MKNVVVWLPLAAVLGGIVGAWGPMEELAALKDVNARILPALFPCGVVSVSSGMTLEQAYLARS